MAQPRPWDGLPGEFIPLAESTGLILQLGRLAIEKVCRQIMLWSAAGIAFGRVAINISPQQMEAPAFLEELDAVLASHPAAIGLLTFEITETACAAKPARTRVRRHAGLPVLQTPQPRRHARLPRQARNGAGLHPVSQPSTESLFLPPSLEHTLEQFS